MKATINFRAVSALSKISALSKGDIRYYLYGVNVQVTPDTIEYAATNGHVLAVIRETRDKEEEGYTPDSFECIIPHDIAKAKLGHSNVASLTFDKVTPKETRLDYQGAVGSHIFEAIDAKFPDYQRLYPQTCSGETAQFDPALPVALQSAYQVYSDTKKAQFITIAHNGNAVALACGSRPEFLGLIMPIRGAAPELPEWSRTNLPARLKIAA